MSCKHFINDPTHLVTTALHSLTLTNPNLAHDPTHNILYLRPNSQSSLAPNHNHNHSHNHTHTSRPKCVSIISGGGSGHEPSFSGLVGPGLLDASVAGTIFASPSSTQVRTAIMHRVDPSSAGVLVVVLNYTGDVLNFGVAVEQARAAAGGIGHGERKRDVEMVVVGDDVGVGRKAAGKVGRRGLAGMVLVLKIAGAAADMGFALGEVAKVASLVAGNLVSVGASLGRVHVPGRVVTKEDDDGLGDGVVEIGMGIHNEPGSGRETIALPALVEKMLGQLLDEDDEDRGFLKLNSNEIVLLVNNLGGVSVLEMGGITAEVVKQLKDTHNIKLVRILTGAYMTSLNGLGFSITLLNVVNTELGGPSMIELLDRPAEAVGWSAPVSKVAWDSKNQSVLTDESSANESSVPPSGLTYDVSSGINALKHSLEQVIAAEPDVTHFDDKVGDGDCGIGLKRGAEAVLKQLSAKPPTGDVVADLANIVKAVESTMDGTSGALYTIFLNSLLHHLQMALPGAATPKAWGYALQQSSNALAKYTPAKTGDRTLIDALHPYIAALNETGSIKDAAEAALAGAQKTQGMKASLGRTVYVGGSGFEQVPDPGAWGLAAFLIGFAGLKMPAASSPKADTKEVPVRASNTMSEAESVSADESWESV